MDYTDKNVNTGLPPLRIQPGGIAETGPSRRRSRDLPRSSQVRYLHGSVFLLELFPRGRRGARTGESIRDPDVRASGSIDNTAAVETGGEYVFPALRCFLSDIPRIRIQGTLPLSGRASAGHAPERNAKQLLPARRHGVAEHPQQWERRLRQDQLWYIYPSP